MNHAESRPALPLMARALIPREIATWATIALTLAALEGGLAGVLVKSSFGSTVPVFWVNIAVAVVAGAPAFANVLSFAFAAWAQGRSKTRFIAWLMAACGVACVMMSLAPLNIAGLLLLCAGVVTARVLWSGVVTLRASVWRVNFQRAIRARITGRIITISGVIIGLGSMLMGRLLDLDDTAYRWIFAMAAVPAFVAAWLYRRIPVRRQQQLLQKERSESNATGGFRFRQVFQVLSEDPAFRRYMAVMMLFGSGNLMLMAPLIIILNEHFSVDRFQQVLLTSSVPLLLVAVSVSGWARLLDQRHILQYRAVQSWAFVIAQLFFTAAAIAKLNVMFWLGSIALGIAYGGAVLGWNLGHNDFSNEEKSALYMGAHVSLTGLRGLLMPLVGVLLYQFLSAIDPDWGPWVLLLPLSMTCTGAVLFVLMAREQRRG